MTYYGYFFIIGVTRPVILYLRDIRWFIANASFPWRGGSQFFINIADNSFLDWFSPGAVGHVFEIWCWPSNATPQKWMNVTFQTVFFRGKLLVFGGVAASLLLRSWRRIESTNVPTHFQGASKHTVFGRIISGFDVAVGGPKDGGLKSFSSCCHLCDICTLDETKISPLWLKGKSSSNLFWKGIHVNFREIICLTSSCILVMHHVIKNSNLANFSHWIWGWFLPAR